MIGIRFLFLAFLLLVSASASAAGDADWLYQGSDIERDPAWTFGSLPNGLRYAIRQNKHPSGQVSIRVHMDVGSLHEQDHERGWAHLIEHLAFRATKSFGDREGRHIWQSLGASFGSDTNAATGAASTTYMLDLPDADLGEVDLSLRLISEMMDVALFEPAAVAAEQKIVLAEKRRRPELNDLYIKKSWPLFYAGLKIAERDTIGTEETLLAATPKGLRAFYERWYRPERATIIIVGDAPKTELEALVSKNFGAWKGTAPPAAEPDFGTIRNLNNRTESLAYEGAPHNAAIMWVRPYVRLPNTKAREKNDLARVIAEQILNRRLEAKARNGAAYVSASVADTREPKVADLTQLTISPREGRWRVAMLESFAVIRDALNSPPSAAEIKREIDNLRTAGRSALEGEATMRSEQWAARLLGAIERESIIVSARTQLDLFEELAPQMTVELVDAGMKQLFDGAGPRLMLLSPDAVTDEMIDQALAEAEKITPSARQADLIVTMDALPPLTAARAEAKEVARERIDDLGIDIVRFENGSVLLFKQTPFEKGSVSVQLRFGHGLSGLDPGAPSLAWLSGVVSPSGLADLDLEALERLMTGRRMSMAFGVEEDAFVLRGATNAADLSDQLRLFATKLAFPRWDEALFERFKAGAVQNYDLAFASASARAGREIPAFIHGGDDRWKPVEKQGIADARFDDFRAYFAPLLGKGPIEAIVVGDVDLDTVIAAMKKSIAALPRRAPVQAKARANEVRPPKPDPKPMIFDHKGDRSQAYAIIGWNTFGGIERVKERRALSLAAIIFSTRLFDRFREEEGATYSPNAIHISSEVFDDWGIFYAASEVRPENTETFLKIAREIMNDLAAKPVTADEFTRAKNPALSNIQRRLKTNAYWLHALENWSTQPQLIAQTRSFHSDYANLTAEDVRSAFATHVADEGDWSLLVLPAKAHEGGN